MSSALVTAGITKTPVIARSHSQATTPPASSSSSSAKGSAKGDATMDFANRANGFMTTQLNRNAKEVEQAYAQLQKTHEVSTEKEQINKEIPYEQRPLDDYPTQHKRSGSPAVRREERKEPKNPNGKYDTVSFSDDLLAELDAQPKKPLVGTPHIYNQNASTSIMTWNNNEPRYLSQYA